MPLTCMCGYSGRWTMNGQSELVHGPRPGLPAWEPGALQVGDAVTAVLAGPPADTFRILVNGRLVAEHPAKGCNLPVPGTEPLWGVVDIDGACVKVRLSNAI